MSSILVDDSFTTIPTISDMLLENIIRDFAFDDVDIYDTINNIVPAVPEIGEGFTPMMVILPTTVPESSAWILLAGMPLVFYNRRRR